MPDYYAGLMTLHRQMVCHWSIKAQIAQTLCVFCIKYYTKNNKSLSKYQKGNSLPGIQKQ